jgi:hypothetical protein
MAVGRPLNVKEPSELLRMWDEYKVSIDQNPDVQQIATGKGVMKVEVKRPYLRTGFEAWVYRTYGFHVYQYFDNVDNAYEQFLGVVTHIRKECESDQVDGTLTGRYKAPNLVARLHGLTDKQEVKNTGTTVMLVENKPNEQNEPIKD